MKAPLWIDETALRSVLSYRNAVASIADALGRPETTSGTPPRQIVDTPNGQLLLMPSVLPHVAGVKVVTVAPGNPALGLPRINGVYVLFDSTTLVPVAQFDAAALTAVRTAAVSAFAVDRLAPRHASRLLVFGAGPQALAHVEAIAAVRTLRRVDVVARRLTAGVVDRARAIGVPAQATGVESVPGADIIACCTTAREPLFDSSELRDDATVVAVGSHEPDARELDAALVRRATVVVESRWSALTAGDLVLAGGVDELVDGDLLDLVAGRVQTEPGRPRVFKSVGEAWEDLVVAAAAFARANV
jgi:ornithine cyclodeaminase/alanine dehydrogenase-like protein (mu-crystallin family)